MAEDIARYTRAKHNGSPDHSFEWLWAASCRYLLMTREEYMQESLNRSLNGASKGAPGPDASKGRPLYTSDAADEEDSVDRGGRTTTKKKR